MAKHASQRQTGPEASIPDKLYFRIGEVAKLCGIEAYVLRFWESEFPQLRVNKSGTGQRLYRRRDVELVLRIKSLLYSEGYTIAGARQVFASEAKEPRKRAQSELPLSKSGHEAGNHAAPPAIEARLQKLRAELKDILGLLSAPPEAAPARPSRQTGPREARPARTSGPSLFDA
ncbi:MerR family transcriptional regulator [Silvibacterium dinghuense]|uniref:MerR family transcriptional regulator n=1 Tax=Silvibacterium dinghuense TaxID=1560006 RepID=A0A4Q1SIG8_9BACT|nr:MerR family transcriptional regulator [Silvibacterium dinghuense]RXS97396.1 MerR family transcriptional regulator [Silvibacterium dinghuense]